MGVLDRNLDYFGGKRTYQYTEIMGFFCCCVNWVSLRSTAKTNFSRVVDPNGRQALSKSF
jgi:hypothetical protein